MRYRETVIGGYTDPNYLYNRNTVSCGGAWGSDSLVATTYTGSYFHKWIKDVQTPGFSALRKCGNVLPINTVDIRRFEDEKVSGIYHGLSRGACATWTQEAHGSLYSSHTDAVESFLPFEPSYDDSELVYLVNRAVANVRAASLDVATNYAELHKTANVYRSVVRDASRLGRRAMAHARAKYPRLDWSDTNLVSKAFSSQWLNARYGIRPLVYTLEDSLNALTKANRGFKKSKSVSVHPINLSATSINDDGGGARYTTQGTLTGSVTLRGFAMAWSDNWSDDWGFDPLVTGWELLGYSWIFDWFVDVGSYLQAITPFAHLETVSGVSVKIDVSRLVRTYYNLYDAGGVTRQGEGYIGTRTSRVQRYSRWAQGPSLPVWNPRLTPTKLLDLASLALLGKAQIKQLQFRR
jgi:hypothetical protein